MKKESQSLMQIRECEVVPNWVERLVHEVKVVQIVPNFRFCVLTVKNFNSCPPNTNITTECFSEKYKTLVIEMIT